MTRYHVGILSGEEADDDIATFTQIAATSATVETTVIVADAHSIATRCVKFPTNTATTDARVGVGRTAVAPNSVPPKVGSDALLVFQGYSCTSATPTTAISLVTDSGATPKPIVKQNTSNQIEVYDAGGTLRATSTGTLSNSTAAATEWMVELDTLTNGNMTIAIWVGRKLDTVVSTGIAHATYWSGFGAFRWGDKTTGTARGADLYMTHGVYTYCDAVTDSPRVTPWPSGYVVGGKYFLPTGNDLNEWLTGTGTTYTQVDEMNSPAAHPGNDGATTFVQSLVASQRFTVTYTASNPFVSTDTIHKVFLGSAGAIVSGGKVSYYHILRMSGGSDTDGNNAFAIGSTTYTGGKEVMNRPGGGSWDYADFDRVSGVSKLSYGGRTWTVAEAGGASIGAKITDLPGPLVFYQPQGQWFSSLSFVIPVRRQASLKGR